ncbi:acyl CoA:acetate/3-ketoacid CoA transferase [Moorella sp. Hama-1]|uniref:acyl CoA:acetate/3-ketoacid CoA transferase n=1 Tax=Moorella sp. Hama-1 TaxID=2138101 RepID=UPI000D646E86|nr:CoA-transferase [Moorella sp. Hama-1]BCV21398.1 propionate CoA-transferase [Moorella sp. Hama-1]
MKCPKFISGKEVAQLIFDGATIASVGMTLVSACEEILKAIEKSFLETGHPCNLTLIHSAGQSDRDRGIQHYAHEGLVTRIIGSHWGLQPRWMEMISSNKVEAYCMPQGQLAQIYRSLACGQPGKISKVGLGTFVDPRIEGGKMNERTKPLKDLIEVITINNEEYLLYKIPPIDFVIIRGTTADENGNITTEEEGMLLEVLPAVLATKRFGGKVICQVKRVAQAHSLHPKKVIVPGVFVDAIVVCQNPDEDHRQTSSWVFDPAYSGDLRVPVSIMEPYPLNIRKVIGRRALMELEPDAIINLGTGIPNDVVGPIAAEEGILDDITITVESGVYGGIPAGGIDFGIAKNTDALIRHDDQFDFYNGAGADFTFMGAGEMDAEGNINATKMGTRAAGAGGFIDITQCAKHVVFCSTFTADGLKVDFTDGKVKILQEGKIKKLVNQVQQISFSGYLARQRHQKVHFVTERAIFELHEDGPVLVEIAPGIDLEKDILAQMEFRPRIAEPLQVTKSTLYNKGKYGLKEIILAKKS